MVNYRTIKSAYLEISAADPKTALTENLIRVLAKNGVVPVLMSGTKYLINMDGLNQYLSTLNAGSPSKEPEVKK